MLDQRKENLDNRSYNWYERKFRLNPLTPVKIIVFSGSRLGRCLIINIETLTAAEVIYVCLPPTCCKSYIHEVGRPCLVLKPNRHYFFLSLPPRLAAPKVKHSSRNQEGEVAIWTFIQLFIFTYFYLLSTALVLTIICI